MLSRYKIDGIEVYKYVLEPIDSNMYVMMSNYSACIIDPHINSEGDALLEQAEVKKIWIILTHEHYDHIAGVNHFREKYECVVISNAMAKEYLPNPRKNLSAYFKSMFFDKDEQTIQLAEQVFSEEYSCEADVGFEKEYILEWNGLDMHLIETPGHSKGSICIIVNGTYIFTGDSLVDGNPIITRLPGGSKRDYQNITKPFLEGLSKEMIVFPGHGMEGILSGFEIA